MADEHAPGASQRKGGVTIGDIEGGIRDSTIAGRDIHVYRGPACARPNYRSDISDVFAFYTATFVGRTEEQAGLMAFAAQKTPDYWLLKELA
jgi:hypothetical protein